jgi:hypothetical protein
MFNFSIHVQYNWNIVEKSIKHHNHNPIVYIICVLGNFVFIYKVSDMLARYDKHQNCPYQKNMFRMYLLQNTSF